MSKGNQIDPKDIGEKKLSKTGLRPCPFCGGVNLSGVTYAKKDTFLMIQCNDCGATGPVGLLLDGTEPADAETIEARCRALWDIRAEVV